MDNFLRIKISRKSTTISKILKKDHPNSTPVADPISEKKSGQS